MSEKDRKDSQMGDSFRSGLGMGMHPEREIVGKDDKRDIKTVSLEYHSRYFHIDNFEYPEGVRMAVCFAADYDAQLNRKRKNDPIQEFTQGEYGGRVGIWRLLDVFDRYDIKITFFTPGRICELYPESLKEAVKQGHELANHTWEHQMPADEELQEDHLIKATAALQKLWGRKPVGARSGHKFSSLKKHGYIYISSHIMKDGTPSADDLPFYVTNEEEETMLYLPGSMFYAMDDAMYFHYGWFGSGTAGQHLVDPSQVYDIWLSAFRQLYKMGRIMEITFHPFVMGRSLRIAMLERLIIEMKKWPGVWFPTYEELARYCLERFPYPAEAK